MNLIEFTNNLKDPRNTSADQTRGLEDILEAFPYFQSAHFLYLNGLKNQNSFKYNDYLKKPLHTQPIEVFFLIILLPIILTLTQL